MKRYLLLGTSFTALLLLLFLLRPDHGSKISTPDISESPTQALGGTNSSIHSNFVGTDPQHVATDVAAAQTEAERDFLARRAEAMRLSNEAGNPPVSFYGLVVDQDGNPLPAVSADLAIIEEYIDPFPEVKTKRTRLQKQADADGRFEVSGGNGKYVAFYALTKQGYEQEYPEQACGMYGAQSGTPSEPIVFRMWSTNLHEPLVTGEKSFVVIPDGRHYGIDLIKGTIAEGDEGDVIAWIKRPEKVEPHERYGWSCKLTVPGGGLLESQSLAMFTAPETGYMNVFTHQVDAGQSGWGDGFERKRFYVKLRNGQMYGRIGVDLCAHYRGNKPALIRISYAVNPSGSRLLR